MKQYLKIGLLALAVVLATLAIPSQPVSPESKSYTYGYPLPFVQQEKAYDYQPTESVRLGTPKEHPTKMIWLNLFIDIGLVYGLLWIVQRQMKKTR